jgi:hypothetical protein
MSDEAEYRTAVAEFEAEALMARHPPQILDANKRLVLELACPAGAKHAGVVEYSRWREIPLPEQLSVPGRCAFECREGFFDYGPPPHGVDDWHLNFAAAELFASYGRGAMAQDEMQVAEHPALGALREALLAAGMPTMTVEMRGFTPHAPTPILVRGVERRCILDTTPDPMRGRPGIYGTAFHRASQEVVRSAVTALDPPTRTNALAIEAPSFGRGAYSLKELSFILSTAYSGFRAAMISSRLAQGGAARAVAIHTGFWGCGAYGGNRSIMTMLQRVAAMLAGVDRLIFHAGFGRGVEDHDLAVARLLRHVFRDEADMKTGELLDRIVALRLEWGQSDGN